MAHLTIKRWLSSPKWCDTNDAVLALVQSLLLHILHNGCILVRRKVLRSNAAYWLHCRDVGAVFKPF